MVPLAKGCTAYNALTGASGAGATPALKANCFTLPLLQPGDLGGAIPPGDTFETNFTSGQRNIFRQAWQKRADISLVKDMKITERVSLKYTMDCFQRHQHRELRHSHRQRFAEPVLQRFPHGRDSRSTTHPSASAKRTKPSAAHGRFRCHCTWRFKMDSC